MRDLLIAIGRRIRRLWQQDRLWAGLKIVLALVLITIVIVQIDLKDLIKLWQGVSPLWLAASVLCYIALTVAGARRYWLLIDQQVPFRQTLGLVVLQTVIGNFVATSAGLASYIALLRGRYDVKVSNAVGSILISRFADLLLLLLALALAAWALWSTISPLHGLITALELTLGAAALGLVLLLLLRQQAIALMKAVLRFLRLDRLMVVQRVAGYLETAIAPSSMGAKARTARVFALSVLITLFQFGVSYTFIRMVDLSLGAWDVLLIFALGTLISLVPIQVFGGLGVTDLTMLYLYQLLGVPAALAAPAVVSARLFMYVLNLIILLYLPFDGSGAPDQAALESGLDANQLNGPI